MLRNRIKVTILFFNIIVLYINIRMNKKTIWITGGSTGIGRALAIKVCK